MESPYTANLPATDFAFAFVEDCESVGAAPGAWKNAATACSLLPLPPLTADLPPAEDEPAPAVKDPDAKDSPWKRKCRKVLVRSIGEMLGLAAEAFERDAVAEAEAEVNTELIRRVRDMRVTAAKLETLGEEEEDENADENAEDDARKNEQDDTQAPKPMSPGRAEWTEYELLRRRKALLGREVDPPAPRSRSRASTPASRARTPA